MNLIRGKKNHNTEALPKVDTVHVDDGAQGGGGGGDVVIETLADVNRVDVDDVSIDKVGAAAYDVVGASRAASYEDVGTGRTALHDDVGSGCEDVDAGEVRVAAHEDIDAGKVCTAAHDDVGASEVPE